MGLETTVKDTLRGVKDYFVMPKTKEGMKNYILNNYISKDQKKALFDGKTEEEKKEIYGQLEKHIEKSCDKYQGQLDSLLPKFAKYVGIGAVANDLYDMNELSKYAPGVESAADKFLPFSYLIMGAKTLMEAPSMLKYFAKSRDFVGAGEYALSKTFAFSVGLLGPAFDVNSAQRTIKKGVMRESVDAFLKENGVYKPLYKQIWDRVENVAGKIKGKYTDIRDKYKDKIDDTVMIPENRVYAH